MKIPSIIFCFLVLLGFTQLSRAANAVNVQDDVDTLGGNEDLIRMAQGLKSRTRARIVQDRIVDRRNKIEFAVSYGAVMGGDSYLQTKSLGLTSNYHINPRFSVGFQYSDFSNSLSPEGKRMFSEYRKARDAAGGPAQAVDVDYPLHATMAIINWYPIYGKTSFLDLGITQFDLYLIGGFGQMNLSSGDTPLYSAGVGVGAWLSKHLSLRAEIKYESYKDKPITGRRQLGTGAANVGVGWIL